MFDDTKIEELTKKVNRLNEKKYDLTKAVDKELALQRVVLRKEQVKKDEWRARQKRKSKPQYMNIMFKWDNAITFDTRRDKLVMFKEYVFAYGLPTSFEVKG